MTLVLSQGTCPRNLEVKTYGFGPQVVNIGVSEVPFQSFFLAVQHVLTERPVTKDDDPRLPFIRSVSVMKEVEGYTQDEKRLWSDVPPCPACDRLCGEIVLSNSFPPQCAGWEREYEFSLEDFLQAAYYVLTNTDLESNDPRREFVERVKKIQVP